MALLIERGDDYQIQTVTPWRQPWDGEWVLLTSYGSGGPSFLRLSDSGYSPRRPKPTGADIYWNGTSYTKQRQLTTWSLVNEYGERGYHRSSSMASWASAGSQGRQVEVSDLAPKLIAAVKNQKVNLAMAMAEYRQTASMFSDYGGRIARAYRYLRRGDAVRMLNALGGRGKRRLGNNWLSFQYGVRPLYLDMIGSIKALEDAALARAPLYRVSVAGSASATLKIPVSYQYGPDHPVSRTCVQRTTSRLTCYYTVDNGLIKTASALGFTNPVALAWELVPYSFVVDWFINVGDWLEQLDSGFGIERLVYFDSQRHNEYSEARYRDGISTYTNLVTSRAGPFTNLPSVQLSFSPSLSWKRIVSGIALLRQSRS